MSWKLNNDAIQFVTIDADYLDHLRTIEPRIRTEHPNARSRPFVGLLLSSEGFLYAIPMSSRKDKYLQMHDREDMVKLKGGELGVLNLNNAFPVREENIHIINIEQLIQSDDRRDKSYGILLSKQFRAMRSRKVKEEIIRKMEKLHDGYARGKLNKGLARVCCNFPRLEKDFLAPAI